jgi:protease IV
MTAPWQEGATPPPAAAAPRARIGFWRGLGRLLLWGFAGLGFLGFCGGLLAAVVITQFDTSPDLPEGAIVLTVDLDRGVVERAAPGLGLIGGGDPGLPVRPLADALELAAIDPEVAAVALNLGNSGMQLATAEDVRAGVAAVVAAGKPVYAYAAGFGAMSPGTIDYYLASAASEIWLMPSGDLSLIGLSLEAPFVAGTLEELDVQVQFAAREEYKSAVETFTRAGFSGPARESLQRVVDSMQAVIDTGIAEGRGLSPEQVRAAVDSPPMAADAALEAGLIDEVGYEDEFFRAVEERHPDAQVTAIATYMDAMGEPSGTVATVAYIQATGPVIDSADDPFDTSVIAPDNVGLALASALEDPAIAAVILRIDSPGGSYTASDQIWRQVVRLREAGKPVVASMANVAASGGYFIAMGADRIVAQPGTITGSIGVFAGKFVIDAATRNLGLTWDRVESGDNSSIYSFTEAYTPAQWQAMNATLDRIYRDFVQKAADARGMDFAAMEAIAGGRVWSGADAHARGLVDALGGPSQAFAEVRTLLDLPPDAPLAVRILPPVKSTLEELFALFEDPTAAVSVEIALPAALAPWPEILDFLEEPGALLRLPPMRVEG